MPRMCEAQHNKLASTEKEEKQGKRTNQCVLESWILFEFLMKREVGISYKNIQG